MLFLDFVLFSPPGKGKKSGVGAVRILTCHAGKLLELETACMTVKEEGAYGIVVAEIKGNTVCAGRGFQGIGVTVEVQRLTVVSGISHFKKPDKLGRTAHG